MNKRKIITLCISVSIMMFSTSCRKSESGSVFELTPQPSESGSISDLVQHFKDKGIEGTYGSKFFSLIGASDGGSYIDSGTLSIEIYKFDSSKKARDLSRSLNLDDKNTFNNGTFMMVVHTGNEKIISAFNSF